MATECENCMGEGTIEVSGGYTVTGSGFGDCDEIWTIEQCPTCDGTGEVLDEDEEDERDHPIEFDDFEGVSRAEYAAWQRRVK